MVRTFAPGTLTRQSEGCRRSTRYWLMRALAEYAESRVAVASMGMGTSNGGAPILRYPDWVCEERGIRRLSSRRTAIPLSSKRHVCGDTRENLFLETLDEACVAGCRSAFTCRLPKNHRRRRPVAILQR